jgi:peroxiredoxin
LGRIGVPATALPAILRGLKSPAGSVFAAAASAAGHLGPAAGPAIPHLTRALKPDFQDAVVDRWFRPVNRKLVMRDGPDSPTTARLEAIRALGKIGAAAAPAVPLLRQIAQSTAKDAGSLQQAIEASRALEGIGDGPRAASAQESILLSQGAQVRINQQVPGFSVTDLQGTAHPLSGWRGQYVLLVFVDTKCPCVTAYDDRMRALHERYGSQGLRVIYVFANPNDSAAAIQGFTAARRYPWLAVRDADQKLTRLMGARVTSEAYLLDQEGVLRYHGRIDDNIFEPGAVKERSLENAVIALRDRRPVARPETKALGCALPRPEKRQAIRPGPAANLR